MLFKFIAYHPQWKWRSINWELKFFEKIWHRTDMIFVCVSNDNASDFVFDLSDIVKIWHQNIHAMHTLSRKTHTDINDNRIVICLENSHISTDLAKTAKRSYSDFVFG